MKRLLLLVTLLSLQSAWAGEMDEPDVAMYRKELANAELKWKVTSARENPAAQFQLGVNFGQGKGVVLDYAESAKWFRLAADQGIASAQYNLGWSYSHGKGVVQDYAEAVKWYRLAAKQGHEKAYFNLGVMYYEGLGVEQDYVKAHIWFNLSAVSGDSDAVRKRDIAAKLLTGRQLSQAQKLARECQSSGSKVCV